MANNDNFWARHVGSSNRWGAPPQPEQQRQDTLTSEEWFLSTTIANHITHNQTHVYDYISLTRFDENSSNNVSGGAENVHGVGKLEVLFRDSEDQSVFARTTLDQVLVIPTSKNLISVEKLVRSGQISFLCGGKVSFQGHTIAVSVGGAYKMFMSRAPPFSSPPVPTLTFTKPLFPNSNNTQGPPPSSPSSSSSSRGGMLFSQNRPQLGIDINLVNNTWTSPAHMTPPVYTRDWASNPFEVTKDETMAFISAKTHSHPGSTTTTTTATATTTAATALAGIIGDKPPSPQSTPTIGSRRPSALDIDGSETTTIEEWHSRLAHLDYQSIKDLTMNGHLVISEEEANKWENTTFSCPHCQKAREEATRDKIGDPSVSEVALKSTQPLELIHASLCGPTKQRGLCGARYFLIIVDDYSRYTFTLPVSSAQEVGEVLVMFIEKVEALFMDCRVMGLKVTQECRNKRLVEFARNSDVLHLQTVPNRPQMKGVAERMKRTLYEAAIAIQLGCGVDDAPTPATGAGPAACCIWDEAVRHAAGLRNRCPNRATNGVPLERFLSRTSTTNNNSTSGNGIDSMKLAEFAAGGLGCDVASESNGEELGVFFGFDKLGYCRIFNPTVKQLNQVNRQHVRLSDSFHVLQKHASVFSEYCAQSTATPLVTSSGVDDIMPF